MKRLGAFAGLLAVLLVLTAWLPVSAEEVPSVTNYINDYAGIVDSQTEQELNRLGAQLEKETGSQIVVVTLDSLDGQDPAMLATRIGNAAKVGSKADNGVVILVSMGDRQRFMAIGSGLEGTITDIDARHLQEDYLVPAFQAGNYSKGIADLYQATAARISQSGEYSPVQEEEPFEDIIFSIAGGVFVLMIVFVGLSLFSKKGSRRREVELTVGQSWPMRIQGFDFDSGTVLVQVGNPAVVEVRPGGILYGLRPGNTTVTVQKAGEKDWRFDVQVRRKGYGNRANDNLLQALYWSQVFGSGSRRGGSSGFRSGGGGGFHSGGGFRGGGGGFRGGGAGGSW